MSIALLTACSNGPKVIDAKEDEVNQSNSASTGIFSDNTENTNGDIKTSDFSSDIHNVKVLEILPTDKYVYLRVEENDEEFWIATRKQEIELGSHYFYKGGLLKTQFESKEYKRIFDKIYLVSNVVPANHSQGAVGQVTNTSDQKAKTVNTKKEHSSTVDQDKFLKISELVNNKASFEGKVVELKGTCVKVNPNIMGRNWIHIKDGTMDDYDLVITSSVAVPEGHEVAFRGTVTLNRDFGAGYTYELLVENGELIK